MPEYSVIMTCWGKLEEVSRKCIPSFYDTNADWEFIVVDNASPDGTAEWLRQESESNDALRPLVLLENKGYAGGMNAGLERAQGDYIVCMNNDIRCLSPSWLDHIFAPVKDNPRRIIGPRLIIDNAMTDVGGGAVPYLEGWLVGGTKDFWDEMDGWGSQYKHAWFEDVDLSFRAVQAGYELYPIPDAPVFHMFGQTAYRSGLDFHAITRRNKAKFAEVYWNAIAPEQSGVLNV